MKSFNKPEMAITYLSKEDIIRSSVCDNDTCYGFICDDCFKCVGRYSCEIFDGCGDVFRGSL